LLARGAGGSSSATNQGGLCNFFSAGGIASARVRLASVPAEHEELDRQHQRLNPQDHGVHDPDGVHGVENEPFGGTDFARGDKVDQAARSCKSS
jgi:hypothetical protein